ncbi:hydroxyglutarate oxidase [Candidatus Nitrosocosmicus sp.]|nr:hydroxyglutarate oxidase [Candidatus Nitrosocosmicus sp.]
MHTSSRNTGKVHAPFIYNPEKKKIWAKAALYGYDFWKKYCHSNDLLFVEDGVMEVAIDTQSEKTLLMHFEWGLKNGLSDSEIKILNEREVSRIEPNLKCQAAILCNKDASVNYGRITQTLAEQISNNNKLVKIVTCSKVTRIKNNAPSSRSIIVEYIDSSQRTKKEIDCNFLINASGSNSINILNSLHLENPYQDLFFRGEYWIAPPKYDSLTSHSIYSVPQFQQFPFLDPHWIIRASGTREIGPNACPVFTPYGYNNFDNARELLPKIYRLMTKKGHRIYKTLLRKELLDLISKEAFSSISKRYMINRVKRFLPSIDPKEFRIRGTAGIRSVLIDKDGCFVPNPIFIMRDNILHILNYNSPGATGAFPISYAIAFKLLENGILKDCRDTMFGRSATPFDDKLLTTCRDEIDIDFV